MESVVYQIQCMVCKEERGLRRVYIGEPGMSGFERGEPHGSDWRNKLEGSSLYKHQMLQHDGKLEKDDMVMTIISKPRKALSRQVEEAVRIAEEEKERIINSKSMFGSNRIPRITILMGDKLKTKRKDQEKEREKAKLEKKEQEETVNRQGKECMGLKMEEEEEEERPSPRQTPPPMPPPHTR